MAKNGLHLITPTSVAVASGSATINANGSVSFSDTWSISLNGVFSADYDNYRIVTWHTSNNAASSSMIFRMRASGSDNATSNSYVSQMIYATGTSVLGSRLTSTQGEISRYGYVQQGFIADFYGPFIAQRTAIRSVTISVDPAITNPAISDVAATHNQSVSYDGFSFGTGYAPATLTGRVAVYGMRK